MWDVGQRDKFFHSEPQLKRMMLVTIKFIVYHTFAFPSGTEFAPHRQHQGLRKLHDIVEQLVSNHDHSQLDS